MIKKLMEAVMHILPEVDRVMCVVVDGNLNDDVISKWKNVRLLWFKGAGGDPIYAFWRLQKMGVLASECHVIFTEINTSLLWRDLEKVYGGLMWGNSIFMMRVKSNMKPPVVPSQKRLYLG